MLKNKKTIYHSFSTLVNNELGQVEDMILSVSEFSHPIIFEVTELLTKSGGKRLRAIITLLSGKLFQSVLSLEHIYLATAVELIHSATLLHDDVIDESSLRRGKTTANKTWGSKYAVLIGDFLFSKSFELMVRSGSIEALAELSKASSVIAEGEVFQLDLHKKSLVDQKKYFNIIEAKTATLFAAATEVGAIISNVSVENRVRIKSYGYNLGMSFQIIDDILDYSAKKELLGKNIGDDFLEGKITLPLIICYNKAKEEDLIYLENIVKNKEEKFRTIDDFKKVIKLFDKYDVIDDCIKISENYKKEACKALEQIDVGSKEVFSVLYNIADFSVKRVV